MTIMEKIKTEINCPECSLEYTVVHSKKEEMEYCPFCGGSLIMNNDDDLYEDVDDMFEDDDY
jgi:Zn finger protein HypA/HybF involved in hydrogenase expression